LVGRAESAVLGINANSFGIYVYELSGHGLTGHGASVDVTFGSALPTGTFVTAYGCHTTTFPCKGQDVFSTPFTQSGLAVGGNVHVAEPPAFLIIGADMLGFACVVGLLRRRWGSPV
jgi:hypothetical protein